MIFQNPLKIICKWDVNGNVVFCFISYNRLTKTFYSQVISFFCNYFHNDFKKFLREKNRLHTV